MEEKPDYGEEVEKEGKDRERGERENLIKVNTVIVVAHSHLVCPVLSSFLHLHHLVLQVGNLSVTTGELRLESIFRRAELSQLCPKSLHLCLYLTLHSIPLFQFVLDL